MSPSSTTSAPCLQWKYRYCLWTPRCYKKHGCNNQNILFGHNQLKTSNSLILVENDPTNQKRRDSCFEKENCHTGNIPFCLIKYTLCNFIWCLLFPWRTKNLLPTSKWTKHFKKWLNKLPTGLYSKHQFLVRKVKNQINYSSFQNYLEPLFSINK